MSEKTEWEAYCWRSQYEVVFKSEQGKMRVARRYSAAGQLPQVLCLGGDDKYVWRDWRPKLDDEASFESLEDVEGALNCVV